MFRKILIANRGEIALRILSACKELGVQTVAVYSEADRNSLHVRFADEAICIGPPRSSESYLNIPQVISAAEIANVDAIHPGYGFLSENANFAEVCEASHITFIGPSPEVIRMMGEKDRARQEMAAAGLPIIPGSPGVVPDEESATRIAAEIGYPVMIKAAEGGGGRGMRLVRKPHELLPAFRTARTEAEQAFGSANVYIEKLIEHPRHIEFQVLGDRHGHVIHLGERECSLQRRHQKVLEESPSPALNTQARNVIGETVAKAMREIGYLGVGTVEFLYEDGKFYFIEMNTRIQVEHPVTEMITDIDLIFEQIRAAVGNDFTLKQSDIKFDGHAIECRINAENPVSFRPSPGKIMHYHAPGGLGVRIDSAVYQGYSIPPYYDSLVGKLIVHGKTRTEALMRLKRAIDEVVVDGIETTLPLFRALVRETDIIDGNYHIHWLEQFLARGGMEG